MRTRLRYILPGLSAFGIIFIYWNIIGAMQNYKLKNNSPVKKNLITDINEFFTLRENETKDMFINLHQYTFSLNTNVCITKELFLLIVVHSAPYNIKQRTNIRLTYGSVQSYKGRQLGVVFMLGSVDNPKVQHSLNEESKKFGDIVQGNFHDSYGNLSRKHIMGMHWYLNHCSSEFILKVDDDTFVNPFRVVDSLANVPSNEMALRCHVISGEGPIRNTKSKWHTSVKQYPFPVFPPFCVGFAYITSPKAWKALYRASADRRMMDMDDVFVSVVLSLKANVDRVSLKNLFVCYGKDSLADIEQLDRSVLVLDRHNLCSDEPFKMWQILKKNK